jgi:glycosyltransferase involved in cell wall biosynthesis
VRKRLKIVHLVNTLSAGGAELHLLSLCQHLKQKRIDIAVACLRQHVRGSRSLKPDFEKENINVIDLEANSRYDWRFFRRFAQLLKKESPDILHTHLPRADLAGAFARLLYPNLAWVCSVHDIYSRSWSARWSLPMFSVVWRRATAVVAISHAVQSWLVKEHGVPPEKIVVIHYGIALDWFLRSNGNHTHDQIAAGCAVVGSIGRLEPRKGHDRLIQAMSAVCKQVPRASLLIAGHDPWGYGKTLQALIEELRLEEQVRLVGFQTGVAAFLNALDVFAFASRSEGFGQVVIEAMAAGKPVVATGIPPLTEIVKDGETGLLVDPDDSRGFASAIVWLLTHPEQAQQMGKRGQERVYSHFSAEKMTNETLSLYEELLRQSTVKRP